MEGAPVIALQAICIFSGFVTSVEVATVAEVIPVRVMELAVVGPAKLLNVTSMVRSHVPPEPVLTHMALPTAFQRKFSLIANRAAGGATPVCTPPRTVK